METNDRIKKYLDAGAVLGQVTRARAEEIVRELASAGDIRREQTQEWVDNLVERSRKTSEQILNLVRHEVTSQLSKIDSSVVETLAGHVADLLKRSAEAGRAATADVAAQAAKSAQAARHAAEKVTPSHGRHGAGTPADAPPAPAATKKAATKKAPVKKAPATKAAAKKAAPVTTSAPVAKSATTKKSPAAKKAAPHGTAAKQLSPGVRRRLDSELVRRGLVANRQEAQAAIAAGIVLVAGSRADKAARQVAPDEPVSVLGPPAPFVSRGGQKLAAALLRFSVVPEGRRALDAGASTGGFTDCLLQHGATHVYAVDVGHGQLDQRLRNDVRVSVLERVNIRSLTPENLRAMVPSFEPCSLITADLSFISLVTVVPVLCGPLGQPDCELVVLVKPQFEAGRAIVSRGKGVVRDPEVWRSALEGVTSALAGAGTGIMGAMVSPLTGPAGNVEFLVHGRRGATPGPDRDVRRLIAQAVDEAASTRSGPHGEDAPPDQSESP